VISQSLNPVLGKYKRPKTVYPPTVQIIANIPKMALKGHLNFFAELSFPVNIKKIPSTNIKNEKTVVNNTNKDIFSLIKPLLNIDTTYKHENNGNKNIERKRKIFPIFFLGNNPNFINPSYLFFFPRYVVSSFKST
jgi:hypothetical protein